MILDALGLLSDSQAVTATAVSTNTVDLMGSTATPVADISNGEPMGVIFNIEVAADFTTTDETYVFEVITSAAAALTSPTVVGSKTLVAADRAAGSIITVPIAKGTVTQRYLGARYTTGGTTPTVTVSAYYAPVSYGEKRAYYKSGYTVS